MRDRIRYLPGTPSEVILDLAAPDYGHPDGRTVIQNLLDTGTQRGDLVCDRHHELLYLQRRPPRNLIWGIHYKGGKPHKATAAGESDAHKYQKEYWARAATTAGYHADTEVTLPTGARSDLVVYGDIGDLSVEMQVSPLKAGTIYRRTKRTELAGNKIAWVVSREPFPDWQNRVPGVGMNPQPWNALPSPGTQNIKTGLVKITAEHCTPSSRFDTCPAGNRTFCGKYHPLRQPYGAMTVDEFVPQVAAGLIVELREGKYTYYVDENSYQEYQDLTAERPPVTPAAKASVLLPEGGRRPCPPPATRIWVPDSIATKTYTVQVPDSPTPPATRTVEIPEPVTAPAPPPPLPHPPSWCSHCRDHAEDPHAPSDCTHPQHDIRPPTKIVEPTVYPRTVLDWRDSSHWSRTRGSCRYCGGSTQLFDDVRRYSHKVCAERDMEVAS